MKSKQKAKRLFQTEQPRIVSAPYPKRSDIPLKKLGIFHFVENYAAPVEELQNALRRASDKEDVSQSLIVLPEGFNLGRCYRDSGPGNYDSTIMGELAMVAAEFQVSFVAGLVICEPGCPEPPYNSAVLIDEQIAVTLCRKSENDRTGNYTADPTTPDINNPYLYRKTLVSALMCMDANDEVRIKTVAQRMQNSALSKIVCIPACMSRIYSSEGLGALWPGHWVALANSDGSGCDSIISKNGTVKAKRNWHERPSGVVLCDLKE